MTNVMEAGAELAQPCRFAKEKLVVVGASNGTTSALDYALLAQRNPAAATPPVAALVFLSAGPYTEKQNAFGTAAALFKTMPILFMFPDSRSIRRCSPVFKVAR